MLLFDALLHFIITSETSVFICHFDSLLSLIQTAIPLQYFMSVTKKNESHSPSRSLWCCQDLEKPDGLGKALRAIAIQCS